MGTFNFKSSHNTPHKAVFCLWEDHDEYKEDTIKEYGEDEASKMLGCTGSDDDYSEWYDSEKEYFLYMLKEDIKDSFGKEVDINYKACDGESVCDVRQDFIFANAEWYVEIGIYLEAGYYEGFALDWEVNCCAEYYSSDVPDIESAFWYMKDYTNNDGLAKILAPKFIKKCEEIKNSITDKLDKILMDLAPHNMEIGWGSKDYKEKTA